MEACFDGESKAHFWDALATRWSADKQGRGVAVSIHQTSFYRAAGGSLTWSYDVNNTDKTASGVCLQSSQHTINGSF